MGVPLVLIVGLLMTITSDRVGYIYRAYIG